MCSKSNIHTNINNSVAIRHEIQRFESVHPSIYAIYDLIELIPDLLISQQIRDHVVCIEDSFVNSQEWTLCRNVPDLRIGIVGSLSSGKSSLVHRYLTGSYMQEESPEGGRFKKEIIIDGQSHLLLIRDEGGPPELQFASWVDAVIFVFSLENEASYNAIYSYYTKLAHYRNISEVPIILVGTQDFVNEDNPRVIDENRCRKLSSDLKSCCYYETCATYGFNIDNVFQDACQKIVEQKICYGMKNTVKSNTIEWPVQHAPVTKHLSSPSPSHSAISSLYSPSHRSQSSQKEFLGPIRNNLSSSVLNLTRQPTELSIALDNSNFKLPDLPTPTSTPTASRKVKRRSNLFTSSSKKGEDKLKNGELGSGRAIPLKQGYLYKKSGKTLNKEWKKKYVTLCDDAKLTYHPSLHDYMDDVHGKEVSLQCVTVKIPGQKPRGSKIVTSTGITDPFVNLSISNIQNKEKKGQDKVLLTAFEVFKEPKGSTNEESVMVMSNSSLSFTNGNADGKVETPNVKKRHRRLKSINVKNQDYEDYDNFGFLIVSLDNKQWHFEASSQEERDEWVTAIEQQILSSLQNNESKSGKSRLHGSVEAASILSIKTHVPGNQICADCAAPNPDWASLNLGILICIECSGIHRNLGSHISKVRSLDLDEWPPGHLSVMLSVGNSMANTIWEGTLSEYMEKPTYTAKREEKEQWIRRKYEGKEFLLPVSKNPPVRQQLVDAIYRNDILSLVLMLAYSTIEDVNAPISQQDQRRPLHIACAIGCLAVVQFLLWNSADVNVTDEEGRTCICYLSDNDTQSSSSCSNVNVLRELLIANGCNPQSPSSIPHSRLYSTSSSNLPKHNKNILPLDRLPSSVI